MSYKEVTAGWEAGRLLLFIGRNDEADNADDNQTVCKQIRVSHHRTAPLSKDQRAKKLPPVRGANRLP